LSYELKIALRFLKSGKAQTLFILLGIAIGVSVQIFLGSLITSLQDSLVDRTIGNSSHITLSAGDDRITQLLNQQSEEESLLRGNYNSLSKGITNWEILTDEIRQEPAITAVSPAVQGTGLIRSSGKSFSVQVKGIQLEDADKIYDISSRILQGNGELSGNGLLIGADLARELGVSPGGTISLLIPNGEAIQMLVGGIFDLENEALNESLVFTDLTRAQKLFGLGSSISFVETQLEDPFLADSVAADWSSRFGDIKISDWKGQNASLLSALASQSSSSYTIQFFVILAVTLGISSVLAVSVVQKSKEIGILKAMGATKESASKIFLLQGLILGVIGAVAGSLIGVLLIQSFQFFNTGESSFDIVIKPLSVVLVGMIAIAASTVASVIPARSSANLNPMEAIKNG
jgi:lipoprotein-releasing system permease protein